MKNMIVSLLLLLPSVGIAMEEEQKEMPTFLNKITSPDQLKAYCQSMSKSYEQLAAEDLLLESAKNYNKEQVKKALDLGASVDTRDEKGGTALLLMCKFSPIELLHMIVTTGSVVLNGVQVEKTIMFNEYHKGVGSPPIEDIPRLAQVGLEKRRSIAKLLLEADANVLAEGQSGPNAIFLSKLSSLADIFDPYLPKPHVDSKLN